MSSQKYQESLYIWMIFEISRKTMDHFYEWRKWDKSLQSDQGRLEEYANYGKCSLSLGMMVRLPMTTYRTTWPSEHKAAENRFRAVEKLNIWNELDMTAGAVYLPRAPSRTGTRDELVLEIGKLESCRSHPSGLAKIALQDIVKLSQLR